jgi:hypothetical protein
MKYILIALNILIINIYNYAQVDTASSILYWSENPITWDDFKGAPSRTSPNNSEFGYVIGYRNSETEIEDGTVTWIETYCYMDRYSSWAKSLGKSKTALLYHQTQFDLVELYSRKLQTEINLLTGDRFEITNKLNTLLNDYGSRLKGQIGMFDYETDGGSNSTGVEYWNQKTKNELKALERSTLPNFYVSKFGIGMSFDFGYGILTGNSTDYFSNNFNFAFGFDVAYKPIMLFLRGTLGFNSIKKDFTSENLNWSKDLNTGIAIPEITLGYPLLINDNYSITPFAGIGWVEFSVRTNDQNYKDYRLLDFTYVLGLNFDYNFSKQINLLNYFLFREKSNWLLRARFTAAPFNIDNNIKGWSYNLTIGVGGFANFIDL